jgi:hypothetical protein
MYVKHFCAIHYVAVTTRRTTGSTSLVVRKWVLTLSVLQYVIAGVLKKE